MQYISLQICPSSLFMKASSLVHHDFSREGVWSNLLVIEKCKSVMNKWALIKNHFQGEAEMVNVTVIC